MEEDFEVRASLGELADPSCFTEKIEIGDTDPPLLREQLRAMLLIRRVEEKLGDEITAGKIATPCHLAIGQEAIAVGLSQHLRKSDRVFGTHRSHPHYLSMGGSVYSLLSEVLGKADGCSRGMGGSMHLYGSEFGFVGSVPIVAGTIPLAVGAAIAARKDHSDDIAVTYFGDGASEEGVIHECLNLAALMKLPVLFVCENNLFSSHLHISLRQSADRVGRFADAHGVAVETVDGNDVVAVGAAAGRLIERMRAGAGPGFLEAVTYRWRGHVGPREDNDVGVNRGTDLVLWKARDPVRRLFDALRSAKLMSKPEFDAMDREVSQEVNEAWTRAESGAYPDDSAVLDLVYCGAR